MKPTNMQTVRSLVFKSETTAKIVAIFNETIIKVKTKEGDYIGEVIENLMYGYGFVLKTKSGIGVNILFENIIEIFYGE